jgi:hypothetical protein
MLIQSDETDFDPRQDHAALQGGGRRPLIGVKRNGIG